jgi:gliding motility-associated-like protein
MRVINAYLQMRKIFFFISAFACFNITLAQQPFQKKIAGSGSEMARHVLETSTGYLVVGYTTSPGGSGGKDGYLAALDPSGNVLWERVYGGANDDQLNIAIPANSDGFLVIGDTRSAGNGENDVWLMKVDLAGTVVWSRTFGGYLSDFSPVHAVMVNMPDGYIISGPQMTTPGNGVDQGTYFIRLNEDGNVIWSKNYEVGGGMYLVANFVKNDIIYAGGSHTDDACFAKLDANTGDIITLNRYGGAGVEALYNIQETPDGNYLLSDHTRSYNGDPVCWVMKVTEDGTIIWSKLYQVEQGNIRGIAWNTQDGGFMIAPFYSPAPAEMHGIIIKADANGAVEWGAQYGNGREQFIKSIPTADQGYFGVGRTFDNNGKEHIYVVKTAPDGSFGTCCGSEIAVTTLNFSPERTMLEAFEDTPFEAKNWPVTAKIIQLEASDFCAGPVPPVFETEGVLCTDNQASGSVTITNSSSTVYSLDGGTFLPATTYNLLAPGTYSVVAQSPTGCTEAYSVIVPFFSYNLTDSVAVMPFPCELNHTVSVGAVTGQPPFSYALDTLNWVNQPVFEDVFPGVHQVFVRDVAGCLDTVVFEIEAKELLSIGPVTVQNIDCNFEVGAIQVVAQGGASAYSYALNTSLSQPNPVFDGLSAGSYTITITDAEGCTAVSEPVSIFRNVNTFQTSAAVDICKDAPLIFPDGTSSDVPGTYTFLSKASNGCDSTHVIRLGVTERTVYIPNVFHPDDDGTNDWFTVYTDPVCVKQVLYLRVFDRWGDLFFERKTFSPNVDKLGWGGDSRQKNAPAGVYAYDCLLELHSGATVQFSGDVTLVR